MICLRHVLVRCGYREFSKLITLPAHSITDCGLGTLRKQVVTRQHTLIVTHARPNMMISLVEYHEGIARGLVPGWTTRERLECERVLLDANGREAGSTAAAHCRCWVIAATSRPASARILAHLVSSDTSVRLCLREAHLWLALDGGHTNLIVARNRLQVVVCRSRGAPRLRVREGTRLLRVREQRVTD